jgi:Zn-dependent metalloprotease
MQRLLSLSVLLASFLSAQVLAGAPLCEKGWQDRLEIVRQRGFEHLQTKTGDGFRNGFELKEKRAFFDEQGFAHLHVQETFAGIPVFGSEAIVHMTDAGDFTALTDELKNEINVDNLLPSLDAVTAAKLAVENFGCSDCLTAAPEVDVWILPGGKRDYLVYRVQLRREDGSAETSMPVYFIDAHTGKVVWSYDNLQTATGSGSSLYSGTVSITTYLGGSTYYMEDTGRKVGTFDNRNSTSSTYRFTDADNGWTGSTQRAGVDAHYGAAKTYDYFLNVHGRRGIDGNGGPGYYTSADGATRLISSKVHYSSRYNNAFWNGSYMTYGDGDGSTFSPLVTLDICGHEMTHGVTERTAGLVYSNESGALNEAVSDIFGAMVERYSKGESSNTWKIGEDAYTPSTAGDALRYMDNPAAGGDPDHYSERYTGTADNGGVHTNSGIANKAFHILAKGGSHSNGGSMTGIGADAAARIWYRALTSYMTSSTNFKGARTATLNAAAAIYGNGSTNYNAVAQSWTLCGVN